MCPLPRFSKLPVKRLSFTHAAGDTHHSLIASEFLQKSKDTLEVLEIGIDPSDKIMLTVMKDLERLKVFSLRFDYNESYRPRIANYENRYVPLLTQNDSIESLLLSGIDGVPVVSKLLDKLPNVKNFSCGLNLSHDQWRTISVKMTQLEEIHLVDINNIELSDLIFPSVKSILLQTSKMFIKMNDQLKEAFQNVETLKIFESEVFDDGHGRKLYEILKTFGEHWPHVRNIELGKGFQLTNTQLMELFNSSIFDKVNFYDESLFMNDAMMFNEAIKTLKRFHVDAPVECPKFDYRPEILNFTKQFI